MAREPVVFLDLDGTLIESHYGILECARLVFEAMNVPLPTPEEFNSFIGPSIRESFERYHIPYEKMNEAVSLYRHLYNDADSCHDPTDPHTLVPGRLACKQYDGIEETLRALYESQKYTMALATCKPEDSARAICEHFGLSRYLHGIYGASLDSHRSHKAEVLRYAQAALDNDDSLCQLMVGDRYTDTQGALACHMDCLGCSWGYAEEGELLSTGAYRVIDKVEELPEAINEYFHHKINKIKW